MLEEACKSEDGRVKLIALRILELQNKKIQDLELENWAANQAVANVHSDIRKGIRLRPRTSAR